MTDIVQILTDAKALISDPEKWTQGTFARGVTNRPVKPNSNKACRWCAIGALDAVTGPAVTYEESNKALEALWIACPDQFVSEFNDAPSTTHADIMALFDRAIARSREAA